ncbi:hypothetical protein GCM10023205_12110 [Yinghuangia aomiensis]|uniref:Uncharacterized protein n=1 Tax=Yinghuangia aomiensis TaxID=676205 RepID=A0ABP9GST9_9ACTN
MRSVELTKRYLGIELNRAGWGAGAKRVARFDAVWKGARLMDDLATDREEPSALSEIRAAPVLWWPVCTYP